MVTEIGIVAGEIWHFLDKNGEVSFSKLKAGLDHRSQELILMSLGWLAREGHVFVNAIDNEFIISLR